MAYRADIEIGVKGIQQLQAVTKQINTLATGVDGVNKRLAGATQSIDAYNVNLAKAAATLNKVNAGTIAEADAIRQYVTALGQANAARDRQNKLIQQQIVLQRKAVPTANAGFGVQGPALPPAAGGGARGGRGVGGRLGGAISGSIIGGAFPLLFGQGGGAAAGGAIGGLVGGLAGPGGSFAGSLLGTLLGDIASRGQAVKKLAEDIGFSAEQTKKLSDAFKVANIDVEKFTAVVQNIRGIGLELEDQARAIQLVTRLTEKYGGSFEKTGNAITSALESGKVTQATLNQLTSQGINIQQALADKYNVNRSALLQMAKDGKISVQSLIDTLVDLGNKPGQVAKQTQTASQQFQTAIQNLVKIVGPELERLGKLFLQFGTTALNALNNVLVRLGQAGTAIENAVAGDTLKNARTQFRRDATLLKQLYVTPKGNRTTQQVQQITALENLQQGRMQVINAAKPPAPPKPLQTFVAPSQAAAGKSASDKAAEDAKRKAEKAAELIAQSGRELSTAQEAFKIEQRLLTARKNGNDVLAITRQTQLDILAINARGNEILANKDLPAQAKINEIEALRYQAKSASLNLQLKLSDLEKDQSEKAAKQLQAGQEKLQQLLDEEELLKARLAGNEAEVLLKQQLRDLTKEMTPEQKAQAEATSQRTEALKQQLKLADEMEALYTDIGMSIKDGVVGAIQSAVDSTKSLGEVARNVLSNIANRLLDVAINFALFGAMSGTGNGGGLLGGFFKGARANGGPVTGGSAYLVGERGPELFVPGRSGTIIPNESMGGGSSTNVVVNVDASGSKVEGNDQQGNQLGRVIAAAVQQELIKQKRPGGLLV